ncbi:hypothetical protein PN36_12710 [Candidatus Thiomargarita nelsonii]|uniref:Cytochrome C n=1 Tax=Candidatus Thiomargarita nelsonii TaxID=1003181 RepID=A0A0A6PFP5_9GAMM|nr:hypothetical protein PN36_12710 [Candidatus Thiomargarita nelsonii]
MKIKKLLCGTIIIILTVAVTALVLRFIVLGQTLPASQADKRTAIIVTEAERTFMLANMRAMLVGTQQILQASLNQDMPAVIAAAELLGMKKTHHTSSGLTGKLPLGFKKLALSTHRAFDQIALDGKDLGDKEHSLEQLNEILARCVACHAAYRLIKQKP